MCARPAARFVRLSSSTATPSITAGRCARATRCGGAPPFRALPRRSLTSATRSLPQLDWNRGPNGEPAESPDGQCAPHAYVDAFHRRLERGRWFYTPCLGWKEFVPDYVGPFPLDGQSQN